jgi:hypothetical protein
MTLTPGGQGVAGSNPVVPTVFTSGSADTADPLDAFVRQVVAVGTLLADLSPFTHRRAKPCGLCRSIPTMILLLFVFVEIFSVNGYRE